MAIEKSTGQTRQVAYLILVLFALVVADGLISQFLIGSGLGYEGNPFLINWVAGNDFLAIKVSGAFLSAIILWSINKKWPRLALLTSAGFVIFYTAILLWNILVFIIG